MMASTNYPISGRTMDLGSFPGLNFEMQSYPRGVKLSGNCLGDRSRYGMVGIVPLEASIIELRFMVTGGINDQGLSCDVQTLLNTQYPKPLNDSRKDLHMLNFCQWALSQHSSTNTVEQALTNGSVHVHAGSAFDGNGQHYSLRDSSGRSIVVEYTVAKQQVYVDLNDGSTGFGIMTNEPEYPCQVRAVQHYEWKQTLARPAAPTPGSFYPDDRFLRIHEVKSA